jgi:hypothetical protein
MSDLELESVDDSIDWPGAQIGQHFATPVSREMEPDDPMTRADRAMVRWILVGLIAFWIGVGFAVAPLVRRIFA